MPNCSEPPFVLMLGPEYLMNPSPDLSESACSTMLSLPLVDVRLVLVLKDKWRADFTVRVASAPEVLVMLAFTRMSLLEMSELVPAREMAPFTVKSPVTDKETAPETFNPLLLTVKAWALDKLRELILLACRLVMKLVAVVNVTAG